MKYNFKMPFFLQPERRYVGAEWYQREIENPAEWQGQEVLLHLEIMPWMTRVWLNGLLEQTKCPDGWFTNRKLGYVFEARVGKGRLLASSIDLIETKDRPVGTELRASLPTEMLGNVFRPTGEVDATSLQTLLRKP